jgi:hypothetical protein
MTYGQFFDLLIEGVHLLRYLAELSNAIGAFLFASLMLQCASFYLTHIRPLRSDWWKKK